MIFKMSLKNKINNNQSNQEGRNTPKFFILILSVCQQTTLPFFFFFFNPGVSHLISQTTPGAGILKSSIDVALMELMNQCLDVNARTG